MNMVDDVTTYEGLYHQLATISQMSTPPKVNPEGPYKTFQVKYLVRYEMYTALLAISSIKTLNLKKRDSRKTSTLELQRVVRVVV